jgi:hypothetical protein
MKTYEFILSITNSTIIEVQANNIVEGLEIAQNQAYDTDVIKRLCNPSDVEVDIDLFCEEEND